MNTARPDFVVLGWQANGKVFLMASKTLTEVQLQSESERFDTVYGYERYRMPPVTRYYVTAEMRDLVQIVADSYPEAWASLFEVWSPTPAEQTALPAPVRELPAARRSIERPS